MQLVIRSVGIWGEPNLRRWAPKDPNCIAEEVLIDIGPKSKKGADTFRIRLATPQGLESLEDRDGVLAMRPLIVMRRYEFSPFWHWLERTVKSCEGKEWPDCVNKLRRFFDWEYDDMR